MFMIRGDRNVDEHKVEAVLGTENFRHAEDKEVWDLLKTKKGFIGPFSLPPSIRVYWDNSTYGIKNAVIAFNKPVYLYIIANPGRYFSYGDVVDVCVVERISKSTGLRAFLTYSLALSL